MEGKTKESGERSIKRILMATFPHEITKRIVQIIPGLPGVFPKETSKIFTKRVSLGHTRNRTSAEPQTGHGSLNYPQTGHGSLNYPPTGLASSPIQKFLGTSIEPQIMSASAILETERAQSLKSGQHLHPFWKQNKRRATTRDHYLIPTNRVHYQIPTNWSKQWCGLTNQVHPLQKN